MDYTDFHMTYLTLVYKGLCHSIPEAFSQQLAVRVEVTVFEHFQDARPGRNICPKISHFLTDLILTFSVGVHRSADTPINGRI